MYIESGGMSHRTIVDIFVPGLITVRALRNVNVLDKATPYICAGLIGQNVYRTC